MEELIDVLDSNGNKTGIIKPKSEIKKNGDFHRAISVCIVNDKQEVLMQRRSKNKKCYPNLWSIFVKGHIMAGESAIDACKREIYEELGVIVDEEELEYLYTIKEEKFVDKNYIEKIFFDTFLLIKNIEIEKIKVQKEEVEEIKYMHYEEIKKCILNGDSSLVPNKSDYERIFLLLMSAK